MKNLIKRILNEEVVDIADIQDELLVMPLDVRQKLSDDLKDVVGLNDVSELGEQISYKGIPEIKAKTTVGKLLKWVKRYITDKATNFLINASMDEIKQTISILDVMDPTSTVGIFNPKAMYLGGGIDFAKDAVSWRSTVEDFYGPNHIVDGDRLLELITNGNLSYEGVTTPVLLNPMRAETVRKEDFEFQDLFKKWKTDKLSPEEFQIFQERIREQIVHQDYICYRFVIQI